MSNHHHEEDDWELDINLGLRFKSNVFQRKGVYSMEPDKELDNVCERYKYPPYHHYYSDDDDTNSSVTSGSLSEVDKYSEIDVTLNDLDDYMYDELPQKIIRTPALNYDFSAFPGVVQKLSTKRQSVVQDNDDWNDDIDIPMKGILSIKQTEKNYDTQLLSLDDLSNTSPANKPVSTRPPNKFHYAIEKEDDEDDMSGLDFPEDMDVLPGRLDGKKKLNPVPVTNTLSKPTLLKKIPMPTKSKLSSIQRENDDDDFCDGLHIKEKAFNFPSSSGSKSTPQRTKNKESSTFVSRLARPSPLLNSTSKQSDHAIALSKKSNLPIKPKASTSSRHTFLSGTKASRQREADIAASKSRVKNTPLILKKSLQKTPIQNADATEKKSAVGYTLIAKPKTKKATNYCARLDNIDNLPLKPPTIRKFMFQPPKNHPKGESKSDPDRPWRRNMIPTSGPSKVKLIQPNEQNLKKEYNGMQYDESTHCWKGNETSLDEFQDKTPRRRPMLISNKQPNNSPSRYTAVVGGGMMFDAEFQKWVSVNGTNAEFNELDSIEDLKEEVKWPSASSCSRNAHRSANVSSRKYEFEFSVDKKRLMMAEQEEHERFMENWPIRRTSF